MGGVLQYKWEAYCGVSLSSKLRSQESTAIQMGGVLPYKLEVYCRTFQTSCRGFQNSAHLRSFLLGKMHETSPQSREDFVYCMFKKILTSQNPRNPKKFKVTRKWLKSDFWGLPKSNPQSNFLTRKSHFWVTFRVKKLLLGLLWGRPQKSLFSHFRVTLNFSGFRGFWEVRIFLTVCVFSVVVFCLIPLSEIFIRQGASTIQAEDV